MRKLRNPSPLIDYSLLPNQVRDLYCHVTCSTEVPGFALYTTPDRPYVLQNSTMSCPRMRNKRTYMHVYIYTCIRKRTHVHTQRHTYIYIYAQIRMHTHKNKYINKYINAQHLYAYINAHVQGKHRQKRLHMRTCG